MKNKLIELLKGASKHHISICSQHGLCTGCPNKKIADCRLGNIADFLLANGVTISTEARPLKEWHEDIGDVLWWKFPIEEPPYVGSPLDLNWPAHHTHWTPIVVPEPPKEEV